MPLQNMILLFFIGLCSCYSLLANNVSSDVSGSIEGRNRPIDFTLTKKYNIRLEGNYENLHPSIQEIFRTQIDAAESKIQNLRQTQDGYVGSEMFNKLETELGTLKDLLQNYKNCQSSLEKYQEEVPKYMYRYNTEPDRQPCKYDDVCRSLVGVDKPPICQSLLLKQENAKNGTLPRNCKDVQENGHRTSGLYEIQPIQSKQSFMVLCDMHTKGGGWTHIQKRVDGSVDFYRGWREYKHGFGNLQGEFWIGLENIYALTGFETNELLVEIVDRDMVSASAYYKGFGIGPEKYGYVLNVLKDFSGDAGDSLTDHLGSKFTTKDFDQDANPNNCAVLFEGAWWYKSCHISNLNGKFLNVDLPEHYKFHGLHWKTFRSHEYCHARARMMVRPAQN